METIEHEKTVMPRSASSVSEAQELIKPLINKMLTNETFGTTAKLYPKSVKEMGSGRATSQSISPELHAKAVANVDVLYKSAIIKTQHPDTKGRREIEQVHRFGSIMYDEKSKSYVPVMLTVFEYKAEAKGNDGKRLVDNLYSVEAVEILEKIEARRAPTADPNGEGHVPITGFIKKLYDIATNTGGTSTANISAGAPPQNNLTNNITQSDKKVNSGKKRQQLY